jgi:hypothetical protein
MSARLTLRRLYAIEGALSAMVAGVEGEGDWPEGVTVEDLDGAHTWACAQISKREAAK